MIVNCPTNISEWTKNITPPTFSNTYDEQTKTNSLSYKGGSGYERLYYPIQTTAGRTITFSIKFCSPSGYSCSYGDTQVYFAITTDEPTGEKPIKEHNIVASVPMDGTASNTPVLYTVSYTPSSSSTIYLVIDMGYMVDGVDTTLIYQDISVTSGMWYVEDGKLTHDGLPAPAHTGAFYGCSQLATAHIPKSVKRIGEYAFAGTALTKVKIASDCTYYPTSFPDGCEIEFYPDENESVGYNDG